MTKEQLQKAVTKDLVPVLKKQVSPIVAEADALAIKDEKSKQAATELLSTLNLKLKAVTDEKEKITKPLNDALKVERGRWKPIEETLDAAIATVRGKMTKYQTEQKRIADEKAAKIAARVGEGKGKIGVGTAVRQMEAIEQPSQAVTSESGMVKFRTVGKVEMLPMKSNADLISKMGATTLKALIENELIVWNEVMVRKVVLAAKTASELPGVRYYEEEMPINTRG